MRMNGMYRAISAIDGYDLKIAVIRNIIVTINKGCRL
jgi:hypothetical protein